MRENVFQFQWTKRHSVAETDIDLDRDDGGGDMRRCAQPKASLFPPSRIGAATMRSESKINPSTSTG